MERRKKEILPKTATNLIAVLPILENKRGIASQLEKKTLKEAHIIEHDIREGKFQKSLSLITAFSSLLSGFEVLFEHYRGSYSQRVMYTPVFFGWILLMAGLAGAMSKKVARLILPVISVATALDGVIGFYFHILGVARKPGGWRLPVFNIVMGPPLFAPLLFITSGLLGFIASFLRSENAPKHLLEYFRKQKEPAISKVLPRKISPEIIELKQDIREGRFQQFLAGATVFSAFFSGAEALYSHYKSNFAQKIQWSPIIIAPMVMAAALGTIWSRKIAKTLLPLTSLLAVLNGSVGFFYHVRGIMRKPGGLKMPLYNLTYGPPAFAPLLFASTGFLGLLASMLRRSKRRR